MFSNRFNTRNDPLLEAAQAAMKDGETRRQAEAFVNEQFGVYSRKAVVREELAAYDAALEEAYGALKEGVQIDEISKGLAKRYINKAKKDNQKREDEAEGRGYFGDRESAKYDTRNLSMDLAHKKIHGYGRPKVKATNEELAKKDYDKDGKVESPKDEVWGSRFRAAKAAGKMEEGTAEAETSMSVTKDNKPSTPAQTNASTSGPSASDKAALASKIKAIREEQIDELSRGTLKSYVKKASKDLRKTAHEAGKESEADDYWGREGKSRYDRKPLRKSGKRLRGIQKATDRLEEEQIDEISKGLLGRYIKKANYDSGLATFRSGKLYGKELATKKVSKADREENKKHARHSLKRERGVDTAVGKLTGKAKVQATEETQFDEAAYSAKAARAGKDIGKPGKQFSKIAKKAGAKYGSEERGKKVAGAILARIRAKHMKEENLEELSAFGKEFAAARAAGKSEFMSKTTGKMTSTALKSPSSSAPTSTPTPPTKPVAGPSASAAPPQWKDPGSLDYSKSNTPKEKAPAGPPVSSAPKEPAGPPMAAAPAPQNPDQERTKLSSPPAAASKPNNDASIKKNTTSIAESVQIGDFKYRII